MNVNMKMSENLGTDSCGNIHYLTEVMVWGL